MKFLFDLNQQSGAHDSIRPIETLYRGYRFRSRTEARWAVYFETMGWRWEYELDGYDLRPSGGFYLPDFWLPQFSAWAEVKPTVFKPDELTKAVELCRLTGHHVLLLDSVPAARLYYMVDGYRLREGLDPITDEILNNDYVDEHRFFSDSGLGDYPRQVSLCELGSFDDVDVAVTAARSARFEFRKAVVPA